MIISSYYGTESNIKGIFYGKYYDYEDLKSDRRREHEGRRLKSFVSNICKD
jgi:hypothetical protein